LCAFDNILNAGNGAAIQVDSTTSLVGFQSCAFSECTTGTNFLGDCTYLQSVSSGSLTADYGAIGCGSFGGSFVYWNTQSVIDMSGLSILSRDHAYGAVIEGRVTATMSRCNLTSLTGRWEGSGSEYAAANDQDGTQTSTTARLCSFVDCKSGDGILLEETGAGATVTGCCFVTNAVRAIARY
jgi:hypothetical protein